MTDPAELFADDPWESDVPEGAGGPPRPVRRSAGPNGWKAAALVAGGVAGGALAASAMWCVALLGVVANHQSELFTANYGGAYDEDVWNEFDTDALTTTLDASSVIQEHIGSIQSIALNDGRSYADGTEWDEWFYDVSGEHGSGLVRVRYASQETFHDADLTLPDGTVLDLDLPGV